MSPEEETEDATPTPSADLIAEAMTQYFRELALGRIVELPRWVQ